MSISPCTHPQCDDGTGNPTLTTLGMCEFCRERFHQVLGWLYDDYQKLKTELPKPVRTGAPGGGSAPTGFGHPSEWASVTAQELAAWATEVHNNLKAHAVAEPTHLLTPAMDEATRVRYAFMYMAIMFDALCTWDQAGAIADEANEMHQTIRRGLGQSRLVQRLAAPCPRCEAVTLTKSPGYDTVTCKSCGHRMTGREYEIGSSWTLTESKETAQDARDDLLAAFEHAERAQLHTMLAGALTKRVWDLSSTHDCP